ncbi:DUF6412 domain-containing protein [Curtobacterium sp. MCSS17_007]|uniref:DUF6412 domain-containing protein n=1 Tax=Curtobacterium sp. MCSS17_007 TaxID=2175646 RepID=UPI0011B562A1|nr:DUF6412 domain-containing protein [Curtobacterium sp. MCSS17_007]WIE77108.1 hypothetical protein DEJ22_007605 [Curtobacterium sp. MCSS17_007]
MTVVELLLRALAALQLGDASVLAAGGALAPGTALAVAALGLAAVTVTVLVVRLLAAALGLDVDPTRAANRGRAVERPTRIAWSHPDADGHVRSRAPGASTPA